MGSTWDAYIDSLLGSHEGVKRGAIISATDGSIWARSKDAAEFKATENELKQLVNAFKDLSKVPTTGVDLEGVHFVVPLAEGTVIFGKKGKQGVCAVKSATAILITIFEGENAAGTAARSATEKLAEYLIDNKL